MAAAEPWVSLQDIADRFGWDIRDDDRQALKMAVAGACGFVERHAERRIRPATYARRFHGRGADFIPLPFYPVLELVSVVIDGTPAVIGSADDGIDDRSVVWTDGKKLLRLCGFPAGNYNVRVEWRAGYDPVPDDLRRATETIAGVIYKERRRVGDVAKQAGKGGSATFLRDLQGVERTALEQLRDWRGLYWDSGVPLPGDAIAELGVFELGFSEMG